MKTRFATLLVLALLATSPLAHAQTVPTPQKTDFKFTFGTAAASAGATPIAADALYSDEKGAGFEPSTNLPTPGQGTRPVVAPTLVSREHAITSDKPFNFSVAIPPGNYRVTVTLGDPEANSVTTVKAESRRLMLEHIAVDKGQTITKTFLVNVRRPEIPEHTMLTPRYVTPGETGPMPALVPASIVKLDPREPGSFTWDDKLSLEFMDTHPAVQSIEIHRKSTMQSPSTSAPIPPVVDQPIEPYGSWGQMLPRLQFNDKVCVAKLRRVRPNAEGVHDPKNAGTK